MKYIVPTTLPLLEALAQLSPNSSKTTLRSWIKEGRVLIDNRLVKSSNLVVEQGQQVSVGSRKKFLPGNIEVIYEDSDLVAINKPSGLLSVATNFEKGDTAQAFLKSYYRRKIFVVHRLDQDTSGVMVFAFTEKGSEGLKKLFEVHEIERGYSAIVEGSLQSSSGTWKTYLYEDENYRVHSTDDPNRGEEAITHYKTVKTSKRYSWLTLKLETGKKNQIRVHCQEAGHPIVGDRKYGAQSNPIKRLCLHAHLLAFTHPLSTKVLRFESTPPEDFYRLLKP